MGDSGAAQSDSEGSDSDAEDGGFEFGNVDESEEQENAEKEQDDLSDAVDFSLDVDGVDFGGDSGSGSSGTPDSRGDGTRKSAEASTTTESGQSSGAGQSSPSSSGTVSTAAASGGSNSPQNPSGSGSDSAAESDGGFYDIDPVDESQKAFNFAEKQSKAAYEFAYKEATQNPLARLLRKYTNQKVRRRLEQVFSRKMLGSVFIGMAFTNIINVSVHAYLRKNSAVPWWEPLIWLVVFWSAVAVFVWWERLARKASEAATKAAESASEAAETASEAAESASEKAEAATEAASQAAETATETATDAKTGNTKAPKPTKLDGKGQTAGAYAPDDAGRRRAPARRRAPDRRPNKRFRGESTTQERLSSFEDGHAGEQDAAEEFEQRQFEELPQQGGGFKNAGEPSRRSSADDADR